MDRTLAQDLEREEDLLIRAALSFAGWKYIDGHRFDAVAALEAWQEHHRRDFSDLEMLAMFFNRQRFLYKWGGETLPRNSPERKVFRELFLATANLEVPEAFRDAGWWDEWNRIDRPQLPKQIALVRRIHETIAYGKSQV